MTVPTTAATAPTGAGFPGEGLIRSWAAIAHVNVGGAINKAEQMYAGDPAALRAGSEQAQAVADGLTTTYANLQGVGADAAQAWDGRSGTAFLRAHGASLDQVAQARGSAAGLARGLSQTANSVAAAKNGVATASGLTAVALGTLRQGDPQAIPVARADIEAWAGAIGRLHVQSSGGDTGPTPAGQGGGGGGGGGAAAAVGTSGGAPATMPTGTVADWINQALDAMGITDPAQRAAMAGQLNQIIQRESSGNPNAINNWDSNAAAGTPSKGIMQTIDPTFNSYALPGHTDIWNPVDNIIAGARYAIARYGSLGPAANGPNY